MLTIQLITNIIYYLLKAARRLRRGRPDNTSDEPDDPDTDDEPPPGDMPISILEGGEWWGTGAEMLGLSGPITNPKHLEALFKGYGLDGKRLVQNAGSPKRQAGWDCNSAAPKEFSILVSAVDHPTREALISAMVRAKKDGDLQYLTDVAIYTRRGKGGKILERARPVFALFPELTSDALQPHAHIHGAVINCAGREDGSWGTLFSKPLYLHKLTAGALFQAELGYLLKTEFGLELEPTKYGFRIKRVPKKLVDFYSARHKEIQSKVGPNASARAADAAAQITRKGSPENPPTLDELLVDWQETNDAHGFTQAKAMGLFGRAKVPTEPPELKSDIEKAIKGLLDQENRFSEQQLIREVARAVAAKGVQAKEIIRQVREHLLNTPDVLPLPALKYEPLYTTKEVLAQEQELLAAIAEGKGDKSHIIPDEIIERVLDKYLPIHEGLTNDEFFRNREQRNAAQQIATQTGWISVMEGFAGAGKGYVAKVLAEIFSKAGLEPIGMAPSAVAAGNFQDSTGIDSDTIAMWLVLLDRKRDYKFHLIRQAKRFIRRKKTYAYRGRQKRLTKKSVVFVDEAAMVGTERMLEIVRQVRKVGAKLILIGDRTQLQPIDRGGPFHSIAEQTHVATLSHVVRQKPHASDPEPDWHKNAAILIRNGHAEAAIKKYAERGRLTITKTRDEAILSAARDWSVVAIADKERKKKIIILAGLREDVNALNDTCQSSMSQAGFLFGEPVHIGERDFFVGDTVLFTKNSRALAVKNGDRGVILSVNRQKKLASIRLQRTGKPVIIPYKTYQHLDLGYAMTTYKAQGLTVDEAFVLLGGSLQDRHLSYVQMTRAADSTRLYVDKFHAGPKLRDIIGQIERERPKLMLDAVVSPEWFQKTAAEVLGSGSLDDADKEDEEHAQDDKKPKKEDEPAKKAPPKGTPEEERGGVGSASTNSTSGQDFQTGASQATSPASLTDGLGPRSGITPSQAQPARDDAIENRPRHQADGISLESSATSSASTVSPSQAQPRSSISAGEEPIRSAPQASNATPSPIAVPSPLNGLNEALPRQENRERHGQGEPRSPLQSSAVPTANFKASETSQDGNAIAERSPSRSSADVLPLPKQPNEPQKVDAPASPAMYANAPPRRPERHSEKDSHKAPMTSPAVTARHEPEHREKLPSPQGCPVGGEGTKTPATPITPSLSERITVPRGILLSTPSPEVRHNQTPTTPSSQLRDKPHEKPQNRSEPQSVSQALDTSQKTPTGSRAPSTPQPILYPVSPAPIQSTPTAAKAHRPDEPNPTHPIAPKNLPAAKKEDAQPPRPPQSGTIPSSTFEPTRPNAASGTPKTTRETYSPAQPQNQKGTPSAQQAQPTASSPTSFQGNASAPSRPNEVSPSPKPRRTSSGQKPHPGDTPAAKQKPGGPPDQGSPMAQAIAISRPELPPRDFSDTSHIKIKSTTDVKVLRDAIGRYGRLPGDTMPGGIVTEGEALANVSLHSVSICREEPHLLLINNRFYFDTGLDPEEVALIWHAVLHTGQAAKDFGVLSQWKAIGIDNDTIVACTMMEADNALGATVYGFDSQYRLGPPPSPSCPNPFVEEARIVAEDPKVAEKLLFNFLHRLYPQFFLTIKDVTFTAGANGVFQVTSNNVVAAIGVLTADGTLATAQGESLAPTSFPLVHRALDELVSEFGQYAAREPNIGRTIAYGELVALLRLAIRDGASLEGDNLVRRLLENQRSMSLPRFNYTVRSIEFEEVAVSAATKLLQNTTVWFEGLIASLVAVHYAMQAGDFDLFLRCKKKALGLIEHVNSNKLGSHCHLIDVLPELKEKLSRSCHDNLIPNLVGAACDIGTTGQEREQYLKSAVALCGTKAEQNSPTFCRLIEAKRYLDSSFDPISDLAKARRLDPTSMEPFYTLARIRQYEKRGTDGDSLNSDVQERIESLRGELGFHKLRLDLKDAWIAYQANLSNEQEFAILKDLQRFQLSLADFVPATREHNEPLHALWHAAAARLKRLSEDTFSMELLHSQNPFSMAHQLLDKETPENLDGLYQAIPLGIEPWSILSPRKRGPIKRLCSAFSKEDAGQWWHGFLRRHASSAESKASKIAILLLHELKVRKGTVSELHRQMQLQKARNPQAGLFLLDLAQARLDAMFNPTNGTTPKTL